MRLAHGKQQRILRGEIEKNTLMADKEPLIMLALVVSGVKPGATLPAWVYTEDELNYYEQLIKSLGPAYRIRLFTPPSTGQEEKIIDVSRNEEWLERFARGEIAPGTFYGYPSCCQRAYAKGLALGSPKQHYALDFVGIVSCSNRCPQSMNLAQQYDQIISQVLSEGELLVFKQYCSRQ